MMRPDNALPAVYLCNRAVDFRKGIQGLAILVESELKHNPFSSQLFVFCNRRKNAVKLLYWERNGFCLWHKKLEQERFKWPTDMGGAVITLTGQQLNWLLDGYDIRRLHPHKTLKYKTLL